MKYRKLISKIITTAIALCLMTSGVALASPADLYTGPEIAEETGAESTVSSDEAKDTEVSDDMPVIEEIEEVPAEDRFLALEEKGSEEEAIENLPDTWNVTLEDGTETEAAVTWECMDDFDNDEYTSFVFQGKIEDDEISSGMSRDDEDKLIMEIYFDSEVKEDASPEDCEIPVYEVKLSPNSIMPEIGSEQGADEVSGAFAEDFGDDTDNVIEVLQDNKMANSGLSDTAAEIFREISPTKDNYLYNSLTDDEQAFYNNIDKYVTDYLYYGKNMKDTTAGGVSFRTTEFIDAGSLTADQAKNVRWYYTVNNPQAFFLSNTILTSTDKNTKNVIMAITVYPDCDKPEERAAKAEEIAGNIRTLSGGISGTTEYAKSKSAYELLCGYVDYDHDAINNGEIDKQADWGPGTINYDQSIISVFSGTRKLTVCAGYSKSYTALLRTAGMDAFSITSASHEWNKVDIKGDWYATDVTWADQDARVSYDYLLKSDNTLKKYGSSAQHTWQSRWNGKTPASDKDYDESGSDVKYRIDYRLNGGRNSASNPSNYTADTGTIILEDPERPGFSFGGWYEDEACEAKSVSSIKGSDQKDYVLYAKWLGCDEHKWDAGKVTKEPSCVPGVFTYTCTKCGATKTEPIEATGVHLWDAWEVTTYPSCETEGMEARECTECGKIERRTIKAAGHKWDSGEVTRKATLTKNGVKTCTCSVCDDTKEEVIYSPKTFKLAATTYVYNGTARKPKVTVKDSKGNSIGTGHYTLTYSANKNVGKATVTVKFKGACYGGSKLLSFTILPKGTSIKSVSAKTGGFVLKWSGQTQQITGYQIQYSTDPSFAKNNKTLAVSNPKTLSKNITGLKKKQKYYTRVRTYRTVSGKKYYSAWSAVKSVKTKN